MAKILRIGLVVMSLLLVLSALYYYVIYEPQNQRAIQEEKERKFKEQEAVSIREQEERKGEERKKLAYEQYEAQKRVESDQFMKQAELKLEKERKEERKKQEDADIERQRLLQQMHEERRQITNRTAYLDCLNVAYATYTIGWNQACANRGLRPNCGLEKDAAETQDQRHRTSMDLCYRYHTTFR